MSFIYLEKDSDQIYEEFTEGFNDDQEEEEYREDRMEQIISRYGY